MNGKFVGAQELRVDEPYQILIFGPLLNTRVLLLGVAVRKHVLFSEVTTRSNVHLAVSVSELSFVFDIFLNDLLKFNLFLLFLLFG